MSVMHRFRRKALRLRSGQAIRLRSLACRPGQAGQAVWRPFGMQAERGQALAETALFSTLAVILAFGLLAWIPAHRARTAATSAAYACAQFLSQSPNPARATRNASEVAWETLNGDWSGTLGTQYRVTVAPPAGPGAPGACIVHYRPPVLFNGLLGLSSAEWSSQWFISRSETYKAKWR